MSKYKDLNRIFLSMYVSLVPQHLYCHDQGTEVEAPQTNKLKFLFKINLY